MFVFTLHSLFRVPDATIWTILRTLCTKRQQKKNGTRADNRQQSTKEFKRSSKTALSQVWIFNSFKMLGVLLHYSGWINHIFCIFCSILLFTFPFALHCNTFACSPTTLIKTINWNNQTITVHNWRYMHPKNRHKLLLQKKLNNKKKRKNAENRLQFIGNEMEKNAAICY